MHLESYNCVLCQEAVEETVEHLFLGCQFARDSWELIGVNIQNQVNIFAAIDQIRAQSHPSFFLMVIILMCWSIWSARNNFIFKGVQVNPAQVKVAYLKELKIMSLRARAKFAETFDLWIQNLL